MLSCFISILCNSYLIYYFLLLPRTYICFKMLECQLHELEGRKSTVWAASVTVSADCRQLSKISERKNREAETRSMGHRVPSSGPRGTVSIILRIMIVWGESKG
jgi:hypothetical protein